MNLNYYAVDFSSFCSGIRESIQADSTRLHIKIFKQLILNKNDMTLNLNINAQGIIYK